MAKINCRIPDELEEALKRVIAEVQVEAPGGVEISLSTVMRYSLEKYLKEYQERKDKVLTLKINPNKLSINELEKVSEIISNASSEINKVINEDVTEKTEEFNKINHQAFLISSKLDTLHLENLIKQKQKEI